MTLSLYQATVPSYLQILSSVAGLLDKAETHCKEKGITADDIIQARLAEDMKPFAYQISSVCHHSIGAIGGVFEGVFSPDLSEPPSDFAGLRDRMAVTLGAVEAVEEEELNAVVGKPMKFEMGNYKRDFVAENFLLSFSQPNFYFHATTAYDILRWKGLPIGKADFMGQMRTA